jgi:hypothetical protein
MNILSQHAKTPLITSLSAILAYIFREEIKTISFRMFDEVKTLLNEKFFVRLIVDKGEHRFCYALNEELMKIDSSIYRITDGSMSINYASVNKKYTVNHDALQIHIVMKNDSIELYSFMGDMEILKDYAETIFKKHCSPEKQIMYYSVENNNWKFPIFRKPRKYKRTECMEKMLEDVEKFMKNEQDYGQDGRNYKFGGIICGPPGTGKSSTIEIISSIYNMPVYLLNLNTDGMNDTVLLNLASSVPPRCIIAFEEAEKQINSIKTNETVSVTYAGILNAIDGIPRLNHGVVFIATCNSIDNLDKELVEALIRPGRLDNIYTFCTHLNE